MRLSRLLPAIVVAASASGIGVFATAPALAEALLDATFTTTGKSRAAAEYWTFDRMNRAAPRLPVILDPVTLEPVSRA